MIAAAKKKSLCNAPPEQPFPAWLKSRPEIEILLSELSLD
jgi:hypothetical protein